LTANSEQLSANRIFKLLATRYSQIKARLPFTTGPFRCHRRVRSGPFEDVTPSDIRAGSFRPASRDQSDDARSGNVNQTGDQTGQAPNNRRSFRHGRLSASIRINLLFTI
jgi:hypothetical protein